MGLSVSRFTLIINLSITTSSYMITYTSGDLLLSNTYALVNTVNTVGVMGKGIALHFKDAFPNNFVEYAKACRAGLMSPGGILITKDYNSIIGEKLILNLATKSHWRYPSKYEYIESGLGALVEVIRNYNIKDISIPPLGCGNGGLDWSVVKSMMEKYLSSLTDVNIVIYQPSDGRVIVHNSLKTQRCKLTDARAMLLDSLYYYESQDENVSLFVANKLCYFLKLMGEPSFNKMVFKPHHYGPYSIAVDHLMKDLNGYFLSGLEQMDLRPFDEVSLLHSRKDEVKRYVDMKLSDEQRCRLSSLKELIAGYESPLALELLATTAFVRSENPDISLEDTVVKIGEWSERKKYLLMNEDVSSAYYRLEKYSEGVFSVLV